MTKVDPLTAHISIMMTEQELDNLIQISTAQNKGKGQILREGYQFAKRLHYRLNDDPRNYSEMGQEARQGLKEALDLIFGIPKDVVK